MEKNRNKIESVLNEFQPLIKNWEFRFPNGNPIEAKQILTEFLKVYDKGEKHLDAPGAFVISGDVYGHPKATDGTDIKTSRITSVDLVEWGPDQKNWFSGTYDPDELAVLLEHKIFCATTESGSKYYLISDQLSAKMFLCLGKICHCV